MAKAKAALEPVVNVVPFMGIKNAQLLVKSAIIAGIKNHYSTCCRSKSTWDMAKVRKTHGSPEEGAHQGAPVQVRTDGPSPDHAHAVGPEMPTA